MGTIQPSVGILAAKALQCLDDEDLLPVVRLTHYKMESTGQTPALSEQEAVLSLKQYYALPILFPEKKELAVSSVVDAYWHNHLLNTKAYRRFCEAVYGRFMDLFHSIKAMRPKLAV